jgi:hypothetical protein
MEMDEDWGGVPLDAPSQEGLKWLMVGGGIVAGKAALCIGRHCTT